MDDKLRFKRIRAHYAARVDVLVGIIRPNLHQYQSDEQFRTLVFNADKSYRSTQGTCDCWDRVDHTPETTEPSSPGGCKAVIEGNPRSRPCSRKAVENCDGFCSQHYRMAVGEGKMFKRCMAIPFTGDEWRSMTDEEWHELNNSAHAANERFCKPQVPIPAQMDFINFHQSYDRAMTVVAE